MTHEKNIGYSNAVPNSDKEKYSRGRRGAPAKGVGRSRGARVQIPLSPFGSGKRFHFFRNEKQVEKCKKTLKNLLTD